MDDLEIDRTLRATLSENPSPDFVARVRTTLADAPRPSLVAGWLKPAAVVACAAVVAIAAGLPREDAPSTAGLKPSTTTVQAHPAIAPVPEVRSVVVPTFKSAESANPPTRARAIANEPPLPEVIIATDDVEAVRQFVSGARDRRFVATFEETPIPTAWAMNDLAIAPITVEPLDSTQSHNN
jgi:hypothetical protein